MNRRLDPAPADATLAEVLIQIERRDRRIGELTKGVESLQARCVKLEATETESIQRAASADLARAKAEAKLEGAKTALLAARAELKRIKRSRAWRLMMRARKLVRRVRPSPPSSHGS